MNQEQQQPPKLFQRAFTGNQADNVKAIIDNLRQRTANLQEHHSAIEKEAMAALREVVSDLPETAELKKVGFDLDYYEKDGVVIMRELPHNLARGALSIQQGITGAQAA